MKSYDEYLNLVKENGLTLQLVPVQFRNYQLCQAAVNETVDAVAFIKDAEQRPLLSLHEYKNICLQVLSEFPDALKDISKDVLDVDFYAQAIRRNPSMIYFIEKPKHDPESFLSDEDYEKLLKISQEVNLVEEFKGIVSVMNLNLLIRFRFKNVDSNWLLNYFNKENERFSVMYNLLIIDSLESLKKFEAIHHQYTLSLNDPGAWEVYLKGVAELTNSEMSDFFAYMAFKYELAKKMPQLESYFEKDARAEMEYLKKLIADKNPEVFLILKMIDPFTHGYGNLNYIHALLNCVQVAERKNTVNATVLKATEQRKYFELLKNSNLKVRERFCLVGGHWRSGDIEINDKNVNVVIIDPLGMPANDGYNTREIIEDISHAFANKANIFLAKEKRQHAALGCSVMALDDLRHLFTVENFLPQKNLFIYFTEQNQAAIVMPQSAKKVLVIPVDLPLSLMRVQQSRVLKANVIPGRVNEKDQAINKKGQTALASVNISIKLENGIEKNERLDEKFHKMARHNLKYLVSHPLSEIAKAMQNHVLQGFEKRLAEEKEKKNLSSSAPGVLVEQGLFANSTAETIKDAGQSSNKITSSQPK